MKQQSTTSRPEIRSVLQRRLLVVLAQLRRVLNGWVATAIANRERQAARISWRKPHHDEITPLGVIESHATWCGVPHRPS